MDFLRFFDEGGAEMREAGSPFFADAAAAANSSKRRLNRSMAQKRSTAVGRVRAIVSQMVANSARSLGESLRSRVLDAKSDTHRGGDADGGSAANDHVFDGFRDVAIVGVGVVDDFAREAALVEDDDAFGRPADWFDGVQVSSILRF